MNDAVSSLFLLTEGGGAGFGHVIARSSPYFESFIGDIDANLAETFFLALVCCAGIGFRTNRQPSVTIEIEIAPPAKGKSRQVPDKSDKLSRPGRIFRVPQSRKLLRIQYRAMLAGVLSATAWLSMLRIVRGGEDSPLYAAVAGHLETLLARQRGRDREIPGFVEKCGAPHFSTI